MKKLTFLILLPMCLLLACTPSSREDGHAYITLTRDQLFNKIKGAWAAQTIGIIYGDPTEFIYLQTTIPDSVDIEWNDSLMYKRMTERPGTYDDIYMDLAFVGGYGRTWH